MTGLETEGKMHQIPGHAVDEELADNVAKKKGKIV